MTDLISGDLRLQGVSVTAVLVSFERDLIGKLIDLHAWAYAYIMKGGHLSLGVDCASVDHHD